MIKQNKGILLDVDYTTEEGKSEIFLLIREGKTKVVLKDSGFRPYFYVICKDLDKAKKSLLKTSFGNDGARIVEAQEVKFENEKNVLKLSFNNTTDLQAARENVEQIESVIEKREYDIPFAQRWSIDKGISPMDFVEASSSEGILENIKKVESHEKTSLKMAAFDLETMSRDGKFSNPKQDEIITIAYYDGRKAEVFCHSEEAKGIKDAVVCKDEKEMIERFISKVKEDCLDAIITYNGDSFDFPYLKERCEKLGIKLDFGYGEPQSRRKGIGSAVKLKGMQHLDAYQITRIMARIGSINLIRFDLESVAEALFGMKKEKLKAEEIAEIGSSKSNCFGRLVKYNREDAEVTYKIAEEFLPLFIELSRLSGLNLYETTRAMSSQLVEALLIKESLKEGYLIPNKPSESEASQRAMQSYEGGYVKEPVAGLHENIAVLDFRSLHPSIMIAHNISPETLRCEHKECKEKNISPDKDWFCTKKKGFIPKVLEEVLKRRVEIKSKMKKIKEDSFEYQMLDARQHALKILLNSTYGTLGYARFRWYSRECARAITSWSRHYVRETFAKAEKAGFRAIYGDTDSAFLEIPKNKGEDDVLAFVEKINAELPSSMELEFEGLYKRGLFVTKKEGGAAKKRYALIDFKDNLTIVGFEYVRRDWSKIAKETQKEVLEAVLKDGDPKKAAGIIRKKIDYLKQGKAKKKELIIMTQLQKNVKDYAVDAPQVSAVKKAIAKGRKITVGTIISYIITKNGKSISDKAELEEFVDEGNYDADYYVENQLLPAVIRIMEELGYSKEDLEKGGKQKTLSMF